MRKDIKFAAFYFSTILKHFSNIAHIAVILTLLMGFLGCTSRSKRSATAPVSQGGAQIAGPESQTQDGGPSLLPPPPPQTEQQSESQEIYNEMLQAERDGDWIKIILLHLNLADLQNSEQKKQEMIARAMNLTSQKLSYKELEEVAGDSDFGNIRAFARFILGEKAFERRDFDSAQKYFSGVMSLVPESDLASQAKPYLDQLKAIEEVDPYSVGTILPLSGRNGSIGQKALRGLQMGLGLHQPKAKFQLSVVDSEGNAELAANGVQKLLVQDKVIGIVGSLLSRTAPVVATKANSLGIPSITLSQKSSVTEVGPYVFANSISTELQVRQLVRTAFASGMRKFAIVYPNDPYGVEFANAFWDEVMGRGGAITSVQTYDPRQTDFRYVAQRLVGKFYIEARMEEYKYRSKEIEEKQKKEKKKTREHTEEDVLDAIQDFDAIFVPDSTKAMGQIAAFLSLAGVRNVKLLGTNLWNNSDLSRRAGNFKDSILFVDSPREDLAQSKFAKEFRQIYGEEPTIIEAQAYDAGLLLAEAIESQGARSRKSLSDKLRTVKDLQGSVGLMQMGPSRTLQRPMMTYTLFNGNIRPLTK